MNFKTYYKDYKEFRDFFMPGQINRFLLVSLSMVVFGLISLWITTQTTIFAFESSPELLVETYTLTCFCFGIGAFLSFIGRFIKAVTDKKEIYTTYSDIVILLSAILYTKWGTHTIYIVALQGRESDCLVWAMVFIGLGCFLYFEPIRFAMIVIVNILVSFVGVPAKSGGIELPFAARYNMILFLAIITFWMSMKYFSGLRAFKRMRAIERSRLEKVSFLRNISGELELGLQNMSVKNDFMLSEAGDLALIESARQIDSQIEVLKGVANDVADMARLEANIVVPIVAPYKTEKFFEEVIAICTTYAQGKGLEFKYEFSNSVPSVLRGDEGRLKQLIMRLVTNAVKYTREGSITLKVDFDKTKPLLGNLKITVSDTGIGMKEEDLRGLRARIEGMKDVKNGRIVGTNLGLTTAVGIIFALGGRINISSAYLRGTDISFELEQEIVSTTTLKRNDAPKEKSAKE